MWNRAELKSRGKIAFKANYWKAVLVAFIASIVSGGGSSSAGARSGYENATGSQPGVTDTLGGIDTPTAVAIAGVVTVVIIIALILGVALGLFVFNPARVGCDNFFLLNRQNPSTDLSALGRGFNTNYLNVVKVTFLKSIYVFLWSLLLIIPGIIKSYDYRLVTYLLAENPDMDSHEALETSRELMYGHKMAAFKLDLSFIGWIILGAFTLGLLNLFYVNPYIQATNAELFVELAHPEEADSFEYAAPEEAQTIEFEVR